MSDTTKTPLTAQEIEDWHNRLAANKSLDPRKWPEAIEVGAMMFRDFPRLLSMPTPAPLSPDMEAAVSQIEGQLKSMSHNAWAIAVLPKTLQTLLRHVRAENARLVEEVTTLQTAVAHKKECLGPDCSYCYSLDIQEKVLVARDAHIAAQAEKLAAVNERLEFYQGLAAERHDREVAQAERIRELEAELTTCREDARDIPTIAYMSGAADWKARAELAESALLKSQQDHQQDRRCMSDMIGELKRARDAALKEASK